MLNPSKMQAVMLSKRANIFYLDRCRIMQKNGTVVFLKKDSSNSQPVDYYFNIPDKNTALLLLGGGCSITSAAARLLAESGVLIGFSGSEGMPFFSSVDPVFLTPESEYRPTEYMQSFAQKWFDDHQRLEMAKTLLVRRLGFIDEQLPKLNHRHTLKKVSLDTRRFFDSFVQARDNNQLLLKEAGWAKYLYKEYAQAYDFSFERIHSIQTQSPERLEQVDERVQTINSYLDHGNYLAYGAAAAVLFTLGLSYSFAVLHGKTRRGGLVFDVADLIKDTFVLPIAFHAGYSGMTDSEFRQLLTDVFHQEKVLDHLFEECKIIFCSA